MSKPKHTPGPWTVEYGTRKDFYLGQVQPSHKTHVILDEHRLPIAETCGMGTPTANAQLIAAAPDMLQALKQLADAVDKDNSTELSISALNAYRIIAKATGGAK